MKAYEARRVLSLWCCF